MKISRFIATLARASANHSIVCNIPVDSPRVPDGTGRPSPAWLRPVRKRASASPAPNGPSPSSMMDFAGGDIMSNAILNPGANRSLNLNALGKERSNDLPPDLEALFNTNEYFDLGALSPAQSSNSLPNQLGQTQGVQQGQERTERGRGNVSANGNGNFTLSGNMTDEFDINASGPRNTGSDFNYRDYGNNSGGGVGTADLRFDFAQPGSGLAGENLAMEGMDNVSDGLKGNEGGGL